VSDPPSSAPFHDALLTELAERAVDDIATLLAARVTAPAASAAPVAGPAVAGTAAGPGADAGGATGALGVRPAGMSVAGPAAEPLKRLRVLAHLARAVESRAAQAAEHAARSGATYPELGRAWGMTRQGARRRWPGLVFRRPADRHPLPLRTRSSVVNSLLPQHSYEVLLVEDDEADALLVEEALSAKGTVRSIARATDGVAALEHLRSPDTRVPDLIVLDLNMPRMNGRELLGVLKDDPELCLIPVVVLTTSATPDDVTAAYRQHANAYVTKPVNLDDFLQAVQGIDDFFLETATVPTKDE
jgi:CheY-like chemotaxis protein